MHKDKERSKKEKRSHFEEANRHLVMICMERYLPLLLSHSTVLFSDRLKELQEVNSARKNKYKQPVWEWRLRRRRRREELGLGVMVVSYCEQRQSVRPAAVS